MASYPSQRQMETLSTSLAPSVKKKKPKTTQGKVVPVMKQTNPYKPKAPKKPSSPLGQRVGASANQLGAQRQQEGLAKSPVSTQLNVSYESDPVLARIKALGTQDVANARSEAEALRKKAIIDSGLTDVGAEIGVDQGTIQAAAANPFSTNAIIQRTQAERGRELDESLNQQNLFYGGHRANQLTELATSGAQQQAALQGDIRQLLGGINSGVTEAEQTAALAEQNAMAEAAENQRLADLQQSYIDALYPPEPDLASALGAPAAASYAPQQFLPLDVAAMAGVDPYNYDPYEQAYQEALAQNSIYGQLGMF